MADLTCRCVSPSTVSAARAVAGVQSNLNSLAGRVTDLETEVVDLDSRIDDLEDAQDSAFIIVDNEAELEAALLVGKHILLRGEGNAGVIEISSMKTVSVPGTRIWGYGYNTGGTAHRSKIKCNFDNPKAYGAPFPDVAFFIDVSDVEIAGFDVEGLDANDLVNASYIPFMLPVAKSVDRIHIHDIEAYNIHSFLRKDGYQNAQVTTRLLVENCNIYNVVSFAFSIRESLHNSTIRNNTITLRQDGDPATFPNAQGIYLAVDIKDCTIEGNVIKNANRMGIELFSLAYTVGDAMPMYRNRVINNTVLNSGDIGISVTYSKDALIHGNIVDGAVGIGIESSNGSTLGENSNPHNATITDNIIRNVTSATYATGIACDQSIGDIVCGNKIEGVTSDFAGASSWAYARGIIVYRAKECMVSNNTFKGVDGVGVFMQPAGLLNTEIDAIIQNNVFRVSENETKAVHAVMAQGTSAVVRNNVSYEPVSQIAQGKFSTQFISPAVVKPGFAWTADVSTDTIFDESNLVITY